MANRVREIWNRGKVALNVFLTIPNAFAAELMAQGGWDAMTVDMQHGVHDYASMLACFQALQAHSVTPMARVPWNHPGDIGRALDAGAYGIICPMVNTRAEAEQFVAACRYPPEGRRSNGPVRVGLYDENYNRTANADVLCFAMIETQEALDNLESILDVPGLDAVYVGPNDLAWSLGLPPGLDREEAQVHAIYERLIAETSKRGVRAGIHCGSPAYAVRAMRWGFNLTTVSSDSRLLFTAARSAAQTVRQDSAGMA